MSDHIICDHFSCVRMLFDLVNVRYRMHMHARVHRTVKVNLIVSISSPLPLATPAVSSEMNFNLQFDTDNQLGISLIETQKKRVTPFVITSSRLLVVSVEKQN